MKLSRSICMMLVLMLSLCCSAVAEAPLSYSLGDQIQDFSFTTYDGQEITLSEVLEEKEAVLINIWATWCGPCQSEFPYMEEAYQLYKDQVEILALSCEPTDTDDVLARFAAEMGLTFKIGRDPVDFLSALGIGSIPTTLLIDRFGTICFIESGAQTDVSAFTRLFDAFLGEDYTESVVFDAIPPEKPDVAPSSEEDLAAALNAEGGAISFSNAGGYIWPMVVDEKDGRSVVRSTNRDKVSSEALVNASVSASAGDAIVITFKVSSEAGFDMMQLRINGETVKSFGGEKEWMTYAYEIPADGDYTVTVAYTKDDASSVGEDTLWVDCVALLSGEEAAAALAANPEYPVSEELGISVQNETAREIVFTDPTGRIAYYYGSGPFYIIPEDEAEFAFHLTSAYDPEASLVLFNYDGTSTSVGECLVNGQYVASKGIDSVETTGYCDSTVYLYPDRADISNVLTLTYFRSEYNVDKFVADLTTDSAGNVTGSWAYVENPASRPEDTEPATAEYVFRCVDQDGNPVSGVMLQVCDEETCQVLVSDENGICNFAGAAYAWEIHILRAPEGYTADAAEVFVAPVEGGEVVLTLTKN